MTEKKTLIVGIGNEILTDDGIGPRLADSLRTMTDNSDVSFTKACCGGLEMIELIRGYKKVIFIDAIRTTGGKPGTVYSLNPSDFRETSNLSNLHDIRFLTALQLGRILDMDLPTEINIIAVEITEDTEFSDNLSPQLEMNYSKILEEVSIMVKRIIYQPDDITDS